ncbi:hypothetical protein Srufu_079080 (plasmid) [Streptomyces libani subsp. rufus]|nr:hypothetical protein Srufu_079080 [Streptomyces libani subsp. rufus]
MTTAERPAQTTTQWQLSRYNLNQIDDQLDADGVYAKGYWECIEGRMTVTGLRIGGDGPEYGHGKLVAKLGDTITRHAKGKYSVRAATPEQAAAYRRKDALLAEQRHQLFDLDLDSAYAIPGCICACPPKPAA